MAETIIGRLADGRVLVLVTFTGPSSYSSGGFSQAITSVRDIDAVLSISCSGGYKVDAAAVTVAAGSITVPVYYYDYDAAADGAAVEVADGTDLSGVSFQAIIVGH